MMRKIISAGLCGLIAVSLTACGIAKKPAPEPEAAVSVVESAPESTVEEPQEPLEEQAVRANSEVRESTAMNPMFQFGETSIVLGSSLIGDLFDGEAVFVPSEAVENLEFVLTPGQETDIKLTYEDSSFTVTAKNDTTEPLTVKNAVVSAVYADQGPFFAIGGIKIGESIDELTLALGEPFEVEDGVDTYSDITAYHYTSQYNDKNVTFFVSGADGVVVSFYEKTPIHYLANATDISDKAITDLISQRKAPSHLTESPYMLDVDGSDHAVSKLSDVTWTSAKVYALDELHEAADVVPVNYLVVEYEGRLDYNDEDIRNLSILESALEPSYVVYGYFYLENAYLDENGKIKSDGDIHEIAGVYSDEETMMENLIPVDSNYTIEDYSVSEMSLT